MERRILVLAVATVVLCAAPGGAADHAGRCASAKLKATAKKASTKLKCFATAYAHATDVDQACLTKAETKFSASWRRIEAAGGCRTTGDEHETEIQVDALVSTLGIKLAPCGSIGGVCGGTCPFGLNCFEIGVGCDGEPEPCRCHGSTTTCPSTTSTSTTMPASCGSVGGVCGGTCPFGLSCFEIGVGCHGEPEPCRCHGTTTTCPPTSSTTTTLP